MDVMRCRILFLALAPLVLAGCTMLHSSSDATYRGIPYYLPKSLVVAKVDLWKREKAPAAEGRPAKYEYLLGIDIEKPNGQPDAPTRGEIIADLRERYVLAYSSNPFFNDRYCALTDANSLLKSIEYATKDETPQIILGLAELGRKVGAFVSDRPAGIEGAKPPEASMTVTFDPFDPNDRAAAARSINTAFSTPDNRVDVRFEFPDLSHFRRNDADRKCRGDGGVCFRTVTKTPMRLKDVKTGEVLTANVLVDMVNPYYTGHLNLDRAFMVEKIHRLGFEKGALSQVIMRKPSEALQTVKLPLAVVDVILAVPSNFIAKAAGNSGDVQSELNSQKQALAAIKAQLDSGGVAPAPYGESCSGGLDPGAG